ILIINAFTKLYAMPGLRLGYGICADREVIRQIRRQLPAWNVSVPAQLAGLAALREEDYRERTIGYLEKERACLIEGLKKRDKLIYRIYPPCANFIFLRACRDWTGCLQERASPSAAVRITAGWDLAITG
ncbi:aminotransferase class I/II-fold pyridoxal phosphate-dependent enzyme, partial [Eisenbergiella porci]|uniref:aminotransferase class I/II-fold pyridoxal phosphate-dependent enzyme n=1 Tax=Eisenbergiella porci TaxID=2652274 RepID=UPI002A8250BE